VGGIRGSHRSLPAGAGRNIGGGGDEKRPFRNQLVEIEIQGERLYGRARTHTI